MPYQYHRNHRDFDSKKSGIAQVLLGLFILIIATAANAQTQPPPISFQTNPRGPVRGTVGAQDNKSPVARAAAAAPAGSFIKTLEDGQLCTTVTFEGLADQAAVPKIEGINFTGWLSLIDADAGGNGNFANEPSPETIMFWLGNNPSLSFDNAASKVEFYYSTSVQLTVTAFDENNAQIAQMTRPANFSGCPGDPTGQYSCWALLSIQVPGKRIKRLDVIGGPNFTGFDNLKVCSGLKVDSVELTQAIQQYQTIADLEADLKPDREAPVPIIAGKPAVLRVYIEKVSTAAPVTIEVSGATAGSKMLYLQPQCTPDQRRLQKNGCLSADFYFTPSPGNFDLQVKVKDTAGNETDSHDLGFTARTTNSLKLKAVSICDSKNAMGVWQCAAAADLATRASVLKKIAPTASVTVQTTSNQVKRDSATFATIDDWWDAAVNNVAKLYTIFDSISSALGTTVKYYGMIRPTIAGGTGGQADTIPGTGAASRTSVTRLGVETNSEVVAHETGHTLGLRHTNTNVPVAGAAPPGCYSTARDGATDWPFANNRIQSTARLEVGFDVVAQKALDPQNTYEVMSYCVPRWISPLRYKSLITALSGGAVTSGSVTMVTGNNAGEPKTGVRGAASGPFWLVAGTIVNNTVQFEPLFTIDQGPDTSDGPYTIQVVNAGGTVLASRMFMVFTPTAESTDPVEPPGVPFFSLLVPQVAGAASLVVRSPGGQVIGTLALGGNPPTVQLTSPVAPANLSGLVDLTWSITDPDSSSFTTRVHYSADNGATFTDLGDVNTNTLPVNFDDLPGGSQVQIKLLVSDGVNSTTAVFGPFSVPKKTTVSATILSPNDGVVLQPGNTLYLEGVGTDIDDGTLTGTSLEWSSSIAGTLGTGEELGVNLATGTHTITLKATDSDGNSATQSIQVVIAGDPPLVSLSTRALDSLPTTCVEATIGVTSTALPASQVDYSLDGGGTFTSIPTNRLPFRFVLPGSGFFHILARAFDASGQSTAADEEVFTSDACTTGTPKIDGSIALQGMSNGKFFVDVVFANNGAGLAHNVTMSSLRAVPIGGGTVSVDQTMTGGIPLLIGDIAAGTSRTVRIWLNVTGAKRFSLTEAGTFLNFDSSRFLSFSLAQAVLTN